VTGNIMQSIRKSPETVENIMKQLKQY